MERPAVGLLAGPVRSSVVTTRLAGLFLSAFIGSVSLVQAQNVSCTCRYQGEDYGLGESICLKSSGGLKMATCSMVLNNTSWQISNAPCPVTELQDKTLQEFSTETPLEQELVISEKPKAG